MATGVAVSSLFYSVYTAEKQKDEQEEIDRLNAANLEAETTEASRRVEASNLRTAKLLRTQEAATGFAVGGSTSFKIGAIIKESQRELDWMKTAGASRLDIMRAESSARMRLARAEQISGVFRGISGVYSAGAKEGYWGGTTGTTGTT